MRRWRSAWQPMALPRTRFSRVNRRTTQKSFEEILRRNNDAEILNPRPFPRRTRRPESGRMNLLVAWCEAMFYLGLAGRDMLRLLGVMFWSWDHEAHSVASWRSGRCFR